MRVKYDGKLSDYNDYRYFQIYPSMGFKVHLIYTHFLYRMALNNNTLYSCFFPNSL